MKDLQEMIEDFVDCWAPARERGLFIRQFREVLEAYGKAALRHESLPDTEHQHGDPV